MNYRSLAIFMAVAVSGLRAQPAALNIEVKQPKAAVSPTLYGLMTEEINYSYDGGLYAELVRNRTFRSDWTGILNWFVVEKGGASAAVSVDEKTGPSTALPSSAKLEIAKASANGRAGLLTVRIALVADQSGQTLASASVSVAGAEWKRYKFEIRSGQVVAPSA